MKPRCSDCRYYDSMLQICDLSDDIEFPHARGCEEFVEGHFEADEDDYSEDSEPMLF